MLPSEGAVSQTLEKQRDVAMNATWMYVYTASLFLSCLSTMLATYHMRKLGGDILRSTVRFVITCFLVSSTLHALAGGLFYSFLIVETQKVVEIDDAMRAANATTTSTVASRLLTVMLSSGASSDDSDNAIESLVKPDDRADGGEAAFITKLTHDARPLSHVLTTFLMLENMFFLFGAYWIFLVTKELFKLAMATIDRGMESERATIGKYVMGASGILLVFLVVGLPIVITHDGYNKAYRFMSIAELAAIIVSVLYAAGSLVVLRCSGRKHEHIHGMLMASPLYQRLKLMMLVCIVFTLPYCCLQIALLSMNSDQVDSVPDYLVGLATMLYYLFGAAQALVMGGSQQCCIRLLSPIIPTHIRNSPEWASLRASRRHDSYLGYDGATAAPSEKPVFVISDIESSSALWAIAPPHVIDAAQELHDDLMRSLLPKYRGYEITTVGDSFQLAFQNMQDAVGYALEVQLQLLQAKWPSELDGVVAATKTEWAIGLKPHLIFRGLRVRLGIHDTNVDEEGKLVSQIHLVTGKTLYIGASEHIAREVGDVGFGGQIIVSKRVAAWLRDNEKKVPTPFCVDYYGTHAVSQLEMDVELYELTPKVVDARRKVFRKRRGLEESRVLLEEAASRDNSITTMEFPHDTESTTDESASGDYKRQRTPTAAIREGLKKVMWRKA